MMMLAYVTRRWFLFVLILGVTGTLLVPQPMYLLTRDLPPHLVIAVALFLMSWTMPSRSLAQELRRPAAATWAILLSYTLPPGLAWLVGQVASPDIRVGLLLSASVPCTLASCIIWTRLAHGNEATALLALLGSTLLSWLVTTLWLDFTTGLEVELDTPRMMRDLLLTLVVPVSLAQGLRAIRPLAHWVDAYKNWLSNIAQLFVLAIIFKTTAAVGLEIQSGVTTITGRLVAEAIGLTQAVHLATLAVGWWTGRLWFDRPRSVAIAFASSQKTLPVALFLFENYFRAAFPLAVLPLMGYHIGQLIVDTFIAEWIKADDQPSGRPAN